MRIAVTRSGGVAGIRRRAAVDTAGRGDADDWHTLVRRADLGSAPPHRPAPDRFVYTIEVDGDEVTVGEADLTGPLEELIDRVLSEGWD